MNRKVSIVGVPMDLGQGRRGVEMGPSALRYAHALERLETICDDVEDLGDIMVPVRQKKISTGHELKYVDEIRQVSASVAQQVSDILRRKRFPLLFGGDHSISIGSIAGVAEHFSRLGIIWYDAHGDLNTPRTSPSGNIHGMSLAVSLGLGAEQLTNIGGRSPKIHPDHVVMIGVRDLDEGEKKYIRQSGLTVYTMHDIDREGMSRVMEKALHKVTAGTDGVHLSVDLDALDPQEAPGVGTPVRGGISYRESHVAMEMIAEADVVTSAEFVEVNPILDLANMTANVAVDLMGSLFGEKLL